MRLTRVGTDYIEINERTIQEFLSIPRVHLIKFCFDDPDEAKVKTVLRLYPKTNRFVIDDNVKTYNYILRNTSKKYYVENKKDVPLITFFRKNNKVLVNFENLRDDEYGFMLSDSVFSDVLRNTEVVKINNDEFELKKDQLEPWSGNVIITE